jgi:hypothetical protein
MVSVLKWLSIYPKLFFNQNCSSLHLPDILFFVSFEYKIFIFYQWSFVDNIVHGDANINLIINIDSINIIVVTGVIVNTNTIVEIDQMLTVTLVLKTVAMATIDQFRQ